MAKKVFMEKKKLLTGKMNLELKKRIMKCLEWSVALYAAETRTLTQADRRRVFEGRMKGKPTIEKKNSNAASMLVALLDSNGQLRTERDGDTEKGCQKPAVQQKTTDDDDDDQHFTRLDTR